MASPCNSPLPLPRTRHPTSAAREREAATDEHFGGECALFIPTQANKQETEGRRRFRHPNLQQKGHNQHSLLSVGLTVWKSSLNDECNCVPDFIATSDFDADDAIVYSSPELPHPFRPASTGIAHRQALQIASLSHAAYAAGGCGGGVRG